MIRGSIKRTIKNAAFGMIVLGSTSAMADYPVGNQDHYIVRAGESLRMEVLRNDTGDLLSLVQSNNWTAKGGRTTFDPSDRLERKRRILYTAPANFVGTDQFWYVLTDSQGRKNAAKVTITVKPKNASVLNPQEDKVTIQKNQSVRIDVLQNDGVIVSAGYNNSGLIADFNTWSKKGGQIKRVNVDQNTPQLQYTPKPGFVGVDEFWYSINHFPSNTKYAAKVTVTVKASYSSGPYPSTKPDNVRVIGTNRGSNIVRYYPLDNDIGKNLKIVDRSGTSKEGGQYSVVSDGTLSYTPPSKYQNSSTVHYDKIWYVIEDELGRRNWGVINLTIPWPYRG